MSLASVIFYGEGFKEGQKDASKKKFSFTIANPYVYEDSKLKREAKIAHADGYVDGVVYYRKGIIL